MKKYILFFTVIVSMCSGNISYAQNSILAGKIVDENNKPIPGAVIRISKQNYLLQEVTADGDGLYYSQLLEEASYHIDIVANGKLHKAKKFFLDVTPERKKYYIIRVLEDKTVIDKVDEDPSLKVKVGKLKNENPRDILLDGESKTTFFLRRDTITGKTKSYSSGMQPPKME